MTAYQDAVLADAPLGYWRLGESSGTTLVDSSGNGHDGTYMAGIALDQPSLLSDPDAAALFGGAANAYVPYSAWMGSPTSLTHEAWFSPSSVSGTQTIFCRHGGGGSAWILRLEGSNLVVYLNCGGWVTLTYPGVVAGQTYHVVQTYDYGTLTQALYVNGVLVTSAGGRSYTGNAFATDPIDIGASGAVGSPAEAFTGVIDEVAFYDHALSDTRVATHYAAGTAVVAEDATVTTSRATATASGHPAAVFEPDATVTATRAAATASGKPATVAVFAFTADATIYATPALALAGADDPDVEVEVDPNGTIIYAFRAFAGVVAPDPKVTTHSAATALRHRWQFYDPTTGDRWEFIHNPNQMTSPHAPRAIDIFVTPPLYNPAIEARGGMARVHESNQAPFEFSFSGWIRDEEQYEQLVFWTRKVTRVRLTDHFGRTWSIRFKEFDPDEQRPSHRSDWRFDYDIKATMYGAVA